MEHSELDLREIYWILRRRLAILLTLPLVAAGTAALISLFVLTPIYSASTTLWVVKEGSEQISYNDLLLNRNLTKTYAEVAKSRAVMADVVRRLELKGVDAQQLQQKLTVTAVRDTEILSFTVTDPDPVMAARIADAVAESFKSQISNFLRVDNAEVVDHALVPTESVKPRPMLNTVIAGVLGLMAAVGLAFLLEYLDTSLKSADDVARHLDLPVLGTIPTFAAKAPTTTVRPIRNAARRRSTRTVEEK